MNDNRDTFDSGPGDKPTEDFPKVDPDKYPLGDLSIDPKYIQRKPAFPPPWDLPPPGKPKPLPDPES